MTCFQILHENRGPRDVAYHSLSRVRDFASMMRARRQSACVSRRSTRRLTRSPLSRVTRSLNQASACVSRSTRTCLTLFLHGGAHTPSVSIRHQPVSHVPPKNPYLRSRDSLARKPPSQSGISLCLTFHPAEAHLFGETKKESQSGIGLCLTFHWRTSCARRSRTATTRLNQASACVSRSTSTDIIGGHNPVRLSQSGIGLCLTFHSDGIAVLRANRGPVQPARHREPIDDPGLPEWCQGIVASLAEDRSADDNLSPAHGCQPVDRQCVACLPDFAERKWTGAVRPVCAGRGPTLRCGDQRSGLACRPFLPSICRPEHSGNRRKPVRGSRAPTGLRRLNTTRPGCATPRVRVSESPVYGCVSRALGNRA